MNKDSGVISKKLRAVNYILVADDDLDDQELIQDALADNAIGTDKLRFVNDGEELTRFLADAKTLPSIILLDLNMPRKSGREALDDIKQNPSFKHIPVVMFTTSDSDIDIKECHMLGCNAYLTKPNNYLDLVGSMKDLVSFWFFQAQILHD
ncbi:response regulator receiver protein [Paraglaciecola sp. T6c]|uniref:response regulator n=1 Tax=Pseudoalteromonas atlantica (strain T6c / ATCC BAA-1087) TaxID=3042615 RepID=UPI00005C73C9|nr:response regulator [Paraglaciecola sp. T6c]ABG38954.1 response regulator receiver protein [Paraglaciecola sp. T6c]